MRRQSIASSVSCLAAEVQTGGIGVGSPSETAQDPQTSQTLAPLGAVNSPREYESPLPRYELLAGEHLPLGQR